MPHLKCIFLGTLLLSTSIQAETLMQQRTRLLGRIQKVHKLNAAQIGKIQAIFARSQFIGQGNPQVSHHPMTREQCAQRYKPLPANQRTANAQTCGAPYMIPLKESTTGKACIDQFEFPDIPCEYPVTWVRANEAADICSAMGKRLCDAHEWEGGCASTPPDPSLYHSGSMSAGRKAHNARRQITWAWGPYQNGAQCAINSSKSPGCDQALRRGGTTWSNCGSNTYPAGSFPQCRTPSGIYDQHGNAAEHMNLPMAPNQFTSRGGSGHTEMKGSWFVFGKIRAHKDDCHWRAPYWHGTPVNSPSSHRLYHLGFRCCK